MAINLHIFLLQSLNQFDGFMKSPQPPFRTRSDSFVFHGIRGTLCILILSFGEGLFGVQCIFGPRETHVSDRNTVTILYNFVSPDFVSFTSLPLFILISTVESNFGV